MKLAKKKGVAIPAAILLCSILLLVSLAISSIIMEIVTVNTINRIKLNNELEFHEQHEKFVASGGDISVITDTKYRWRCYEGESSNIKALVAIKKTVDEIRYYSITDFTNPSDIKILAYQTSGELYMPLKYDEELQEDAYFLGGIVELPRSFD